MKFKKIIYVLLAILLILVIVFPGNHHVYISELTGSQKSETKMLGFVTNQKSLWDSPLENIDYPFMVNYRKISKTTTIAGFAWQFTSYKDVMARQLIYADDDEMLYLEKKIKEEINRGGDLCDCKNIIENFVANEMGELY